MVLSQEEIDGCRDAFLAFDKDRSGTIDVWELRQVLEAMVSNIQTFNFKKIARAVSNLVYEPFSLNCLTSGTEANGRRVVPNDLRS